MPNLPITGRDGLRENHFETSSFSLSGLLCSRFTRHSSSADCCVLHRVSTSSCCGRTCFVVIWKQFCFILSMDNKSTNDSIQNIFRYACLLHNAVCYDHRRHRHSRRRSIWHADTATSWVPALNMYHSLSLSTANYNDTIIRKLAARTWHFWNKYAGWELSRQCEILKQHQCPFASTNIHCLLTKALVRDHEPLAHSHQSLCEIQSPKIKHVTSWSRFRHLSPWPHCIYWQHDIYTTVSNWPITERFTGA